MQLIYLFFIAFINSVDNIGVGVAYSIAGTKVPFRKNLLISLMAFGVSYVSSLSGHFISLHINEELASILGMLLMVFMGIKIIYEAVTESKEKEEITKGKMISYKEALSVGIALAIDDVGSSVSSGLIGHSAFMISMPYFVISVLIFFSGNLGTEFFKKLKIGIKANIISGILMILIGLSDIIL